MCETSLCVFEFDTIYDFNETDNNVLFRLRQQISSIHSHFMFFFSVLLFFSLPINSDVYNSLNFISRQNPKPAPKSPEIPH